MNLICCSENCRYQQEGYCKLKNPAAVNASQVGGCSYYQGKNSAPKKETRSRVVRGRTEG